MVVKLGLNLLTVFSPLQSSFSHVQQSSLEVYISVSVMFNTIGILSVYKTFLSII